MPKKYIHCVKKIEKEIKKGLIPQYYKGKKSSSYAICRKAVGYYGTTHHIGLIHPLRKRKRGLLG